MCDIKFDFSKRNYIVAGASSGMGAQIVLELAKAGANVLAIARRQDKLETLREQAPNNITIAVADVCDGEKMKNIFSMFVEKSGKISGYIHTAGIYDFTPIRKYDEKLADNIMQISFWSAIENLQILQKKAYTNDRASFILFSSVASKKGEKGMFAYSAAKAAVSTAVKSIAKEIGNRGMRINAICPGVVRTPMTINTGEEILNKHILGEGEPEDVAGVVMFLLSDRARWITGTDIVVDGGYLTN